MSDAERQLAIAEDVYLFSSQFLDMIVSLVPTPVTYSVRVQGVHYSTSYGGA